MLPLASCALGALVATAVDNMIADGRVWAVEIGAQRFSVPESEVHRPVSKPHRRWAGATFKTEEIEAAL